MNLNKIIDNFVFTVFHQAITFYIVTATFLALLTRTIAQSCRICISKVFESTVQSISLCSLNEVKSFEKLPKHISFLLNEEQIKLESLANASMWAVAFGIKNISMYDSQGQLKQHHVPLMKMIEDKCATLPDYAGTKVSVTLRLLKNHHCNENGFKYQNSASLTAKGGKDGVSITLLSLEDGCEDIVHTAKKLCSDVVKRNLLPTSVTENDINNHLSATKGVGDPDLAILFGNGTCTAGFLPWQLRVTELLVMATHHNLALYDFYSFLCTYNKVQQRFGR